MKKILAFAIITIWLSSMVSTAQTVLVGRPYAQDQFESSESGQAEAFEAVATASGTLSSLTFFLSGRNTSTTVYFGLYADNGAGHPGTLLAQGSTLSPVNHGWNTIAVSSVAISSGITYWLAVLGTNNTLWIRDNSAGSCAAESSSSTTLMSLPSLWSTGEPLPDQCPLAGYGSGMVEVGPPSVVLSPTTLSFGNQQTGSASAPQTVLLTNEGGSTLTISGIGLSGTNATDFTESNNCPSSLGVGGSCETMVTFSPTATGNMTAALSLTDNAQGSPQTVPLSGTGVSHSVTLNWDPPTGGGQLTGYNVYRGITSGGETFFASAGGNLTFEDTDVSSGETYYYEVTASGPGGQSGPSNEAMATVP